MEDDAPPSRVLHLRNFTPEITQHELESLMSRFGEIVHIVIMRAKNQALIQFKDLQSAMAVRSFYSSGFVQINGRKVYIKYSRHQELSNNQTLNRVLLATFHNPYTNQINAYISLHGNDPNVNKQQLQQMQLMSSQYDQLITADWVFHLFSAYGTVEKIVILQRSVGVQALIQFSTTESASAARQYLQSQSVYAADSPVYYMLDVQFSNLTDLKIQKNSPKSRDYTLMQFNLAPAQMQPQHTHHQQQHHHALSQQHPGMASATTPYGYSAFPYSHAGYPAMPIAQPQAQHPQYSYPHNAAAFPGGVNPAMAVAPNNNARSPLTSGTSAAATAGSPTTAAAVVVVNNSAARKDWRPPLPSSTST